MKSERFPGRAFEPRRRFAAEGQRSAAVLERSDVRRGANEVVIDADFILAWAGAESSWGRGSAALRNNTFFGLTANNWPGAVPCSDGSFAGFACFAVPEGGTRSLLPSGQSALSSANGRYLRPALDAQANGGTAADIARAIANAGFNSEFNDEGVTYGSNVQGTFNSIQRRLHCLTR